MLILNVASSNFHYLFLWVEYVLVVLRNARLGSVIY